MNSPVSARVGSSGSGSGSGGGDSGQGNGTSRTAIDVQLALVSHTNNGKTTLTRTLLGADVGEVRDAAHVTLWSEAHTLLESPAGDRLQLWDTPGFGDSVRLRKRLANSDNPIGWFLREVLDRIRDRPFWLGQQALRTARDTADVILYLVNAAENPEDAGYLDAEMQILAWLGKPVLVLLNQVGPPRPPAVEEAECERWRQALDRYPLVRKVLALDAFARCWVHERVFYEALAALLPAPSKAGYARLFTTWSAANARRFRESMHLSAALLARSASDTEAVPAEQKSLARSALQAVGIGKAAQQRRQDKAMQAMVERLDGAIARSTASLLTLHRLDPGAAGSINARVRDNFIVRAPIDNAQAGLLGAIISGATTGVTAEIVSGGLTAGLGALVGGIVGAFTFAGAAWGFNSSMDRQVPSVSFSDPFLRTLVVAGALRYLAIIHYGRGRGQFVQAEAPAFWRDAVEAAVVRHDTVLGTCWQRLRQRDAGTDAATDVGADATAAVESMLTAIILDVLAHLYPGTAVDGEMGNYGSKPGTQ